MSKGTELKPCPFCGGRAAIKPQRVYMDNGVTVHCTECNVHTKTTLYDCTYQFWHGKRDVYITKETAERNVVELWNRRADNEQR